jgi:rRNA maturation protein Nop10
LSKNHAALFKVCPSTALKGHYQLSDEPEYCGVPQRGSHPSPIDAYKDYIAVRMAQGCINALQLFKGVTAQGFKGGYATVWRIVRRSALQSESVNTDHVPVRLRQSPAEVPTVFEIIQWLMGKKHSLTTDQTTLLHPQ